MGFRDEILRGIRVAAILFALGLLVVVIVRMVHVNLAASAPLAAQPVDSPKAAPKPAIIGGSVPPGSIPPPPPSRGNAAKLVRARD